MKIIFIAALILLSACAPETPEERAETDARNFRAYRISMVQIEIEKALRDPDSVDYEVKTYNLDNDAMCFVYRAKNGFGGFARTKLAVLPDNTVLYGDQTYVKYCDESARYERYTY